MKKMLSILLSIVMLLPTTVICSAKPGDVAGTYYSTDIHTILNGHEIDSINIGGQTLISAEDMHFYGFNVNWYQEYRQLHISNAFRAMNGEPPTIKKSNYPSGMPLGNYYETDIITYLEGKPITAYNIGGRTYIHAEQMSDWGHIVTWNGEDRILDILSADRAGYAYSIPLSQGEPADEEGVGSFSINYTKDGIFGTEDANHFSSSLHYSGAVYSITTAFYQNEALFYSTELMSKFNSFVSSGISEEQNVDPSEKYEIINESVKISINGYTAQNISVSYSIGNGHRDFRFEFDGIPKFRKDEINEILFSVDGNVDADKYEIKFNVDEREVAFEQIVEKLKKNYDDYVHTRYYFDDYAVISFFEIPRFGKVIKHLYIARLSDRTVLYDVLEEVRKRDGYNYDDLVAFDVKVGAVKNNIFFACNSPEKNGNFYVEIDSGNVHFLSEYNK